MLHIRARLQTAHEMSGIVQIHLTAESECGCDWGPKENQLVVSSPGEEPLTKGPLVRNVQFCTNSLNEIFITVVLIYI